jgi:HK97 gp10 family phage protein
VVSNARTEDQAAIAVGPAKGYAYGLPLEIGTVHMAPHPFLRPGFDENVGKAITIVGEALWRELAGRGISRPSVLADADVEAPGGGDVL